MSNRRKCFESQIPPEEVKNCLEWICSKVKPRRKNNFIVTYNNLKFFISKEKDGYYASVVVPWSIALAIIAFFVVSILVSINIGRSMTFGAVLTVILSTIITSVYKNSKMDELESFCAEAEEYMQKN